MELRELLWYNFQDLQSVLAPREVTIHMGGDDDNTSYYGKPGPSRVFKEIIPNT